MNFTWALKQMKEGKEVRRQVWLNKAYRMYLEHEIITAKTHKNKNTVEKAYFKITDFKATDWEYYEEPAKSLSDKVKDVEPQDYEPTPCYEEKDVKEFIKQVKHEINVHGEKAFECSFEIIDKLAGERFK